MVLKSKSFIMRRLTLVFILLSGCIILHAQEKPLPAFIRDSLNSYIIQGMRNWDIPGLSIAIVKDGKVIFMKGYGVTTLGSKQPVNEQTIFMIGSNTKAFTATALCILQASGEVNLNDKVRKWMPGFRLRDTLATHEINIVDLLSHRLGFESYKGDFTYWSSNLTRQQVIQKMSLIEPAYSFRSGYGYCNAAYVTAGELIPAITGKNWEQTVREKIVRPLKMNRTLMLAKDFRNAENAASPHTMVDFKLATIPVVTIDNLAPAGSMSSSAEDLAKWLLAQLANGELDDKQILPAEALQNTRVASSIVFTDPRDNQETHFYLYGLGLFMSDRNGKIIYSHLGGVDGFLSTVMFVPEEKLGIVVLTNTDQNKFSQNLANEIVNAFFGLPYKGYSNKSLMLFKKGTIISKSTIDSLRKVVSLNYSPDLPLESFTGVYVNEVYGQIEIKLENRKLCIHFSNHPDLTAQLEHIKNNNFLCTYSNPIMGVVQLPFTVEQAAVKKMSLKVSDFIENTPYVFIKQH
jgi:CubicO group peptidase (beta-lactamase class C family)